MKDESESTGGQSFGLKQSHRYITWSLEQKFLADKRGKQERRLQIRGVDLCAGVIVMWGQSFSLAGCVLFHFNAFEI